MLQPILENDLKLVDFSNNKNINNWYVREDELIYGFSLEELMQIIDEKCFKPIESVIKSPFAALWSSKQFSDFIVVVGKQKFEVHKNVLAAQSVVLEAAFVLDMKENWRASD
jgi:hypothetical protein